jgi:hypothetical protein
VIWGLLSYRQRQHSTCTGITSLGGRRHGVGLCAVRQLHRFGREAKIPKWQVANINCHLDAFQIDPLSAGHAY